MNNLDHIQIELEEKRAEADDIEKMFDVALGEIAHEHVSKIKPIDEHEWCSAVYYIEDGIEGVKIFYDGDYDYLEISNDGLAVLAKARGFDLVKREEG